MIMKPWKMFVNVLMKSTVGKKFPTFHKLENYRQAFDIHTHATILPHTPTRALAASRECRPSTTLGLVLVALLEDTLPGARGTLVAPSLARLSPPFPAATAMNL